MRRDDNDTRVDCNVAAATRVNAYESEMKEGERKQNDGEKRRRNGRRYRKHTAYLFSTYVNMQDVCISLSLLYKYRRADF